MGEEQLPLVVIVGAGVAGLSCARNLAGTEQCRVVVIEANNYVGGRIRQIHNHPLFPNDTLEVGAEFIHGGETIIHEIARTVNAPLRQIFTWAQGDGGPDDEEAPDGGIGYYYLGKDKKLMRFDDTDADFNAMNEALWAIRDATPGKPMDYTVADYLREAGIAERVIDLADAGYGNTMATNLSNISFEGARRIEALWDEDGDHDFRMDPTFEPLVAHLSSPIHAKGGFEIRTSSIVSHVDWNTQSGLAKVSVQNVSGSNTSTYTLEASRVVFTVSIPVLQDGDIKCSPPLPSDKLQAINEIQSSPALKIILRFRFRVWPKEMHGVICGDSFVPEFWVRDVGAAVDAHGNAISDSTDADQRAKERGYYTVIGFAMGDRANRIAALSEADAIDSMLTQMDAMFQSNFGENCAHNSCEGGIVFNWKNSPYIRTGYSFPSTTEKSNSRVVLARPEYNNRAFFAGEATDFDRSFMTLHSSIRTGERAAAQVLKSLNSLSEKSRL